MEFLTNKDFRCLSNPGVTSLQLVSPHNSGSQQVTITQVTVSPGARQARHAHQASEQIWIVTSGEGTLLLADDETRVIRSGEVVRFEKGDVHGVEVGGDQAFVYLAVTSPPIDFSLIYGRG